VGDVNGWKGVGRAYTTVDSAMYLQTLCVRARSIWKESEEREIARS